MNDSTNFGGDAVRTSEALTVGNVYARKDLRDMFGIGDKTIDTGIFRPKGHESAWIFATEDKPSDMTPYSDHLEGIWLHWEGQTSGVKDRLIVNHESLGLELVVFYRKDKRQFTHSGFRYLGRFQYVQHQGAHPTRFVLRALDPQPTFGVSTAELHNR